jgi:hypothetical protein
MITNENIIEFKKRMDDTVRDIFIKNKYVEPMIVIFAIVDGEEKQIIMPLGVAFNNLDKDSISAIIKEICSTMNVIYLSFVSEGWSVESDSNNMTNIVPSESKDRKEIIMVTHETQHTSEIHMFDVIRDDENNLVISDNPIIVNEYKGKFCDFLGSTPILN